MLKDTQPSTINSIRDRP